MRRGHASDVDIVAMIAGKHSRWAGGWRRRCRAHAHKPRTWAWASRRPAPSGRWAAREGAWCSAHCGAKACPRALAGAPGRPLALGRCRLCGASQLHSAQAASWLGDCRWLPAHALALAPLRRAAAGAAAAWGHEWTRRALTCFLTAGSCKMRTPRWFGGSSWGRSAPSGCRSGRRLSWWPWPKRCAARRPGARSARTGGRRRRRSGGGTVAAAAAAAEAVAAAAGPAKARAAAAAQRGGDGSGGGGRSGGGARKARRRGSVEGPVWVPCDCFVAAAQGQACDCPISSACLAEVSWVTFRCCEQCAGLDAQLHGSPPCLALLTRLIHASQAGCMAGWLTTGPPVGVVRRHHEGLPRLKAAWRRPHILVAGRRIGPCMQMHDLSVVAGSKERRGQDPPCVLRGPVNRQGANRHQTLQMNTHCNNHV